MLTIVDRPTLVSRRLTSESFSTEDAYQSLAEAVIGSVLDDLARECTCGQHWSCNGKHIKCQQHTTAKHILANNQLLDFWLMTVGLGEHTLPLARQRLCQAATDAHEARRILAARRHVQEQDAPTEATALTGAA